MDGWCGVCDCRRGFVGWRDVEFGGEAGGQGEDGHGLMGGRSERLEKI